MFTNKADRVAVSRRRFLRVAGLGGLAVTIGACGSGEPVAPTDSPKVPTSAPLPTRETESSQPSDVSEAAEPSAQDSTTPQIEPNATRVKLPYDANLPTVWITIEAPGLCDRFDRMAEGFANENAGARMNAVQCEGTGNNFVPVVKSRMTQAQAPDAILLGGFGSDLVSDGVLEPLDDLMQSSTYSNANAWPASLLNTTTYDGRVYGLPLLVAPFALYYNAGAFEKKGIPARRADFPKTWDELKRISKQFTSWSGDALSTAGYLPGLKGDDMPLWFALNGGGLFDTASDRFVIDQERNLEILQFILDWYKDEYRGAASTARDTYDFQSGPSAFNTTPRAFQRGALAMTNASLLASDTLSKQLLSEDAKNWNVAPFPVGPSGLDTATIGITAWVVLPKNAKHRDDVFRYVDYVAGKGVAESLSFEFGSLLPGNKSIANPVGSQAVEQSRGEAFAADLLSFFLKQRDITATFDTSPIAGFAADVLGLQMGDVIRGKATARDALQQTQKLCQERLEKVTKKEP